MSAFRDSESEGLGGGGEEEEEEELNARFISRQKTARYILGNRTRSAGAGFESGGGGSRIPRRGKNATVPPRNQQQVFSSLPGFHRDLEAVRAYASSSSVSRVGKGGLHRVGLTSSRPNTSSGSKQQLQQDEEEDDDDDEEEEVMELKRQLAAARQDLHFSKVQLKEQSEMLEERDRQVVILADEFNQLTRSISSSGHNNPDQLSPTGPGSPYRNTSQGSLNGLGLGLGSARPSLNKELMQKLRSMTETIKMLGDENAQLRQQLQKGGTSQLLQLTEVDDKKKEDYEDLTRPQLVSLVVSYDEKLKALSNELSAMSRTRADAASKGQEKDKYKALARRLKEERNQYKATCEDKLKEQSELKVEMEKMSGLIGELREHCQQLQKELQLQQLQQQLSAENSCRSVGVQVSTSSDSRASSLTNLRKASNPLPPANSEAAKKAKQVYGNKAASAPANAKVGNGRIPNSSGNNNRTASRASPTHNRSVSANNAKNASASKPPANSAKGARIAKPVSKPSPTASASSSASSAARPSPNKARSRLPQPSPSRIPQPRQANRVRRGGAGSATPTTTASNASSPSPPPPPTVPPPTQVKESASSASETAAAMATPSPPATPPPVKEHSKSTRQQDPAFDERSLIEDDDEEEVLLVKEDGRIQMNKIASGDPARGVAASDHGSADDEGSRDGKEEEEEEEAKKATTTAAEKKPRRVQRTWKHFYEELEERREQNKADSASAAPLKSKTNYLALGSSPQLSPRKTSLPANAAPATADSSSMEEDDLEGAVTEIQAALQAHQTRSQSMSTLRGGGRIHIARPWLKKKTSLPATYSLNDIDAGSVMVVDKKEDRLNAAPAAAASEESSEEDDHGLGGVRAALAAHERRRAALRRIEDDGNMFVQGKVDAMRAKFNLRRQQHGVGAGAASGATLAVGARSDGVTDDDDDVAY